MSKRVIAGYCRERRALSRNIAAGKGLPDSSRLSVSGPEIGIRGLPLLSGNVESGAGIAFVGATEIRSRLGLCRADAAQSLWSGGLVWSKKRGSLQPLAAMPP